MTPRALPPGGRAPEGGCSELRTPGRGSARSRNNIPPRSMPRRLGRSPRRSRRGSPSKAQAGVGRGARTAWATSRNTNTAGAKGPVSSTFSRSFSRSENSSYSSPHTPVHNRASPIRSPLLPIRPATRRYVVLACGTARDYLPADVRSGGRFKATATGSGRLSGRDRLPPSVRSGGAPSRSSTKPRGRSTGYPLGRVPKACEALPPHCPLAGLAVHLLASRAYPFLASQLSPPSSLRYTRASSPSSTPT